jgi:N-carbamoyl-L-amino-acid hydrolase
MTAVPPTPPAVSTLLRDIADVGRDPVRGGYSRFVYSDAERTLREWFAGEAQRRSLDLETDRNGVLWAWRPAADGSLTHAVVTGSHLDSVPGGGAYDGPLGVASAFHALDVLDARGATGQDRALAVAAFPEEEGGRFGVACLGSRLMTGSIDPDRARALMDADGTTFAEASSAAGIDPDRLGPDEDRLRQISAFVELHVEQGRGLVDLGRPVAVGSSILGHGRWRITLLGEGNHAGTTLMGERRDPMVAAASVVLAVRDVAATHPDARATVGRIVPVPGGTNVIASRVDLWLDVRHPDDDVTRALVARIGERAGSLAAAEGCQVSLVEESVSPTTVLDEGLRSRVATVLPDAPVLATGAGHDAGVLGQVLPTAMLFVRNPTGISHAPAEHAEEQDVDEGGRVLAEVLEDLLSAPADVS